MLKNWTLLLQFYCKLLHDYNSSKIQRYSPNETGRGYDKQFGGRKKSTAVFNPSRTFQYLAMKKNGKIPEKPTHDLEFREMVAEQYITVSALLHRPLQAFSLQIIIFFL